jgi:hypothetical protein
MSLTKPKVLKPKIGTSIRKQKKSIQKTEKKEHKIQLNSKIISKQNVLDSSYIISCKSCFWNVPFHNYKIKNETINVFKICQACYSHDLEYVSIPYTKLLKYIRINLN